LRIKIKRNKPSSIHKRSSSSKIKRKEMKNRHITEREKKKAPNLQLQRLNKNRCLPKNRPNKLLSPNHQHNKSRNYLKLLKQPNLPKKKA
jgi:hypothetical protein